MSEQLGIYKKCGPGEGANLINWRAVYGVNFVIVWMSGAEKGRKTYPE